MQSDNARTLDYKAHNALATERKPVRTTKVDAKEDLEISQMIMQAGRTQSEGR